MRETMSISVEALQALFPEDDRGNVTRFEYDEFIRKFTGHIVRRDFRRLSISARQKKVWEAIRSKFGPEASEVSLVLTFAPEEWAEVNTQESA
jgi:hypothetical protein